MHVEKIHILNFMSLGEAELSYEDQGLVLINGSNQDGDSYDSNGAGKSALVCEALLWCLYNKTVRGSKHDDVVNRTVGKNTMVSVWLKIHNKEICVTRYRKHEELGNGLMLIVDNKDQTRSTVRDTEETLQGLLGVSADAFMHTSVIGQGMPNRFTELTDAGRKELLETILRTDVYEKARTQARQALRAAEAEAAQAEGAVEAAGRSLDETKAMAERLHSEAKVQLAENEGQIKSIDSEVATLRERIPELKKEAEEYRPRLEKGVKKLESLRSSASTIGAEISEMQSKSAVMQSNAQRKDKEAQSLRQMTGSCPSCYQDIPTEHVDRLATELEQESKNILSELQVLEQGYRALQEQQSKTNEGIRATQSSVQGLQDCVNSRLSYVSQYESKIEMLLQNRETLTKGAEAVQAQQAELQSHIERQEAEHADLRTAASAKKDTVQYQKFWVDAFPQIRTAALAGALHFINNRLDHYLSVLSESELRVALVLKNDKIDLQTTTRGGTYTSASGGERRRIDMAIALTLNDLASTVSGFSTNFLVCDEPADFIDNAGMERLVALFEEKAQSLGTVFVISHNPALKSSISNILTVEKKDGMSVVRNSAVASAA